MTDTQFIEQKQTGVTEFINRHKGVNMLADKQNEIINSIVGDVKPVVDSIEARPMTTMNHYGDYMAFLGTFDNEMSRQVMAVALLRAGGNAQGIIDAVKLLKGDTYAREVI